LAEDRTLKRKWGKQWDTQIMGYLEALGPISLFKDVLVKNSNSRCLIVGAASETHLVSKFSDDIVGVNISLEELRRIKQLKPNLILGDAQDLPISKCSVDFIVCKSTLHHFNNLNVAMSEMNRVLRKGSYVVLYEPGLLNPIAFLVESSFQPIYTNLLKDLLIHWS
jgi:SAM-dependent methyltransferase